VINNKNKMGDEIINKIVSLLESRVEGLTITEIVKLSSFSRSSIRTELAKLEGAKKVEIRKIGMAKVYKLRKIK